MLYSIGKPLRNTYISINFLYKVWIVGAINKTRIVDFTDLQKIDVSVIQKLLKQVIL